MFINCCENILITLKNMTSSSLVRQCWKQHALKIPVQCYKITVDAEIIFLLSLLSHLIASLPVLMTGYIKPQKSMFQIVQKHEIQQKNQFRMKKERWHWTYVTEYYSKTSSGFPVSIRDTGNVYILTGVWETNRTKHAREN